MTTKATFEVYGTHVEELREAAYDQAVKFFRVEDDQIEIEELIARPVVKTAEGHTTRWKAHVTMVQVSEDD